MKQIAEGLWQSSYKDVTPKDLPKFDVIFWMCGGSPAAVPYDVELVDFAIADRPKGSEHFDRLKKLAEAHADLNVLTVCSVGENRSGLMSALTLVARGMKPQEAVDLVQKNGPHNSPNKPHSFWNPGFVQQVLEIDDDG